MKRLKKFFMKKLKELFLIFFVTVPIRILLIIIFIVGILCLFGVI